MSNIRDFLIDRSEFRTHQNLEGDTEIRLHLELKMCVRSYDLGDVLAKPGGAQDPRMLAPLAAMPAGDWLKQIIPLLDNYILQSVLAAATAEHLSRTNG